MNYSRMKRLSAQLVSRTSVRTKLSGNVKEDNRLVNFVFLSIAVGLMGAWSLVSISLCALALANLNTTAIEGEAVLQQQTSCEHDKKEKY